MGRYLSQKINLKKENMNFKGHQIWPLFFCGLFHLLFENTYDSLIKGGFLEVYWPYGEGIGLVTTKVDFHRPIVKSHF